jgi:acyl-CoA thioesterase YciA
MRPGLAVACAANIRRNQTENNAKVGRAGGAAALAVRPDSRQPRRMSVSDHPTEPHGELVIRTIAMPADTNPSGDIFGGWLMSQMDLGAAIYARNLSRSRVTTVAVDGMSFLNPVNVGDIVNCYASLLRVGHTSMKIEVAAWVQRETEGRLLRVTAGVFTYVAINENGQPHPVHRDA